MEVISYTQARQNLRAVMDKVVEDATQIEVTRSGHESVVMMSRRDYDSLQETLHLLSTPNNAQRLQASMQQTSGFTRLEDV